MLIHALGVNATMWLPNVLDLSRHFRIYAIDTIGDLGKSRLYQFEDYPRNGRAYSQWLKDVFEKLEIQEAIVMGSSMGGDRAMEAIPNIEVEAMDRTGHMMNTENPEFVNHRILKFLGYH